LKSKKIPSDDKCKQDQHMCSNFELKEPRPSRNWKLLYDTSC